MVYSTYFSQFLVTEGFGLNLSLIFPPECPNLLDMGFWRSATFSEGGWWTFWRRRQAAMVPAWELREQTDWHACVGLGRPETWTSFCEKYGERSSQLIQLLERAMRRNGRKVSCRGGIIITFLLVRKEEKNSTSDANTKAEVKIPQTVFLLAGFSHNLP